MADIIDRGGGLKFPGILDSKRLIAPTGYRTPESGQTEVRQYFQAAVDNTWETAYTVTTGKNFYLTDVVFGSEDSAIDWGSLGVSASEVLFFVAAGIVTGGGSAGMIHLSFNIPMKFTSGTVIQHKSKDADKTHLTLIGWEE
jgi:hypothetical protein